MSAPKKSPPQRLQRVMAAAGVGSRRECEVIIEEGRVHVDGEIMATLGVKVDPDKQKIFVDGQRLAAQKLQYFMLNKPPGVVSTASDPSGRPRVIDLIKTDLRVYNVGRLDQSSEGMILVTNDGDLANQLTHPRYGVEKRYHVLVDGFPTRVALRQLEEGMYLAAEGTHRAVKARAVQVKFLKRLKGNSWLEIILDEGRNREIRRLLARIGHKVRTLRRMTIGPLKLADLPVGAHRPLTFTEIKDLKKLVDQPRLGRKKSVKRKKPASSLTQRPKSKDDYAKEQEAKGRGGKRTVTRGRAGDDTEFGTGQFEPPQRKGAIIDSGPVKKSVSTKSRTAASTQSTASKPVKRGVKTATGSKTPKRGVDKTASSKAPKRAGRKTAGTKSTTAKPTKRGVKKSASSKAPKRGVKKPVRKKSSAGRRGSAVATGGRGQVGSKRKSRGKNRGK